MSIINTGLSAIGKLFVVAVLLAAFLGGMAGVVYMSLSGDEIKVPEITGKDFYESEKELAGLGLRIRKRADRPSTEKINTVLEQLPKAGETVKTGQWISVVVSKAGVEGEEAPKPLPNIESDDSESIEEMISEKPKKAKSNTNTSKKKADTTRDVLGNISNSNSAPSSTDADSKSSDSNKKGGVTDDKGNKTTPPTPPAKPQSTPGAVRMTSTKPGTQTSNPRQ